MATASSGDEISDGDDLSFWNNRNLNFRILILGRANAGKTTILERLSGNSIDEAEVFRDGALLIDQVIKGQRNRGSHTITDEIHIPSLPGFVFHDSCGFEAGSSEELSMVQEFIKGHSSEATRLQIQLHAIWLCLPLDDSRVLQEIERDFVSWLCEDIPLIVIFTKHDGAIHKVTQSIVDNSSSSDSNTGRAFKKQARTKAEDQVSQLVKEYKKELRSLSQANSYLAFLVTGGMQEATSQSSVACRDLVKATESGLNGPRLKTLLSIVWSKNLLSTGYWCLYWMMDAHGPTAAKPVEIIDMVCKFMIPRNAQYHQSKHDDHYQHYYDYDNAGIVFNGAHHHRYYYNHGDNAQISSLKSTLGSVFHQYSPSLSDVEIVALAVLLLVLIHATHIEVQSSSMVTMSTYISTISHFIRGHHNLVQDKLNIIIPQVSEVIKEFEKQVSDKKVKGLDKSIWELAKERQEKLAEELVLCVENNLI